MDLFKKFVGTVYVGRATIRHESEPTISDLPGGTKQLQAEYPECYPHILCEFHGLTFGDLMMEKAGLIKGSSGLIVDYQKLVRDRSPLEQVEAWRSKFDSMDSEEKTELVEETTSLVGNVYEEVLDDVLSGAPFVVLTENVKLDVPLPISAKREKLAEIVDSEMQVEMLDDETVSILLERMS